MHLRRSFPARPVAMFAAAAVVFFSAAAASGSAPIVVTNTGDAGPGSLRQAIVDANASSGNTIVFHIPTSDPGFNGQWFTIAPVSSLPALTSGGTTIDGSTEAAFAGDTNPAGPEIELDGTSTLAPAFGLNVQSSNNHISDLVIGGFRHDSFEPCCHGGNGINLSGANNVVTGSYIGVDPTGTSAVPNDSAGIGITPNAGAGNRIGGTAANERNVISGNGSYGVLVLVGDDHTVVEGNYIGTNAEGTAAIPSGVPPNNAGEAGVHVQSNGNTIRGNVISGNNVGIGIFNSFAAGNVIQGNLVGTDAAGNAALGNAQGGIVIGSSGNTIGGTRAVDRNVVSGNGGDGINLSGPSNRVEGNYIGTNAAGTVALPNAQNGVDLINFGGSPDGTVIGGNLISGNSNAGIATNSFFGPSQISGTTIQGNLIGTDASGTAALPNGSQGVQLQGTAATLIGGTTAAARNVISGNGGGVFVFDGCTGTTILGNYVGTDATGAAPLGNAAAGVGMFGTAADTVIGGAAAGAGNVISANVVGIEVFAGPDLPTGTTIQGNRIGTDAAGLQALGNTLGGIGIDSGATNLVIGGTAPGAGNEIGGNDPGINLGQVVGAIVEGNDIGTSTSGTPLPNRDGGVVNGGGDNTIESNMIAWNGGDGIGDWNSSGGDTIESNRIFSNAGSGVEVDSGTGTTISRNSIFSNGALGGIGIDLGGDGVTLNNCCGHVGPNDFENFPVLTSTVDSPSSLVVKGTIDTSSPQTAVLEFFANPVPTPGGDSSGYGQGAVFLGTASPAANGSFSVTFAAVAPGTLISATATDAAGNTSEFAKDSFASPATADQCKNGGWKAYGVFKNQGDCVSYVATGGKNPPG